MKRFALAIALVCVLSGSVLAGDVHSTGAPNDPPPPSDGNQGAGGRSDDGNQGTGNLTLLILDLLF